jgi:hypothetical protein
MYGWLTNTGVKFVVVVDMEGRPATALDSKTSTAVGLRDADLKPVSIGLSFGDLFSRIVGFQSVTNSIYHALTESIL